MKKILSLLLALTMLVTVAAPAASAVDSEHLDIPIVRVNGTGDALYSADGKKFELNYDTILDGLTENFDPLLEKFINNTITGGDYEEYAQELYNLIVPVFEDIRLNEDGEVSDGSHPPVSPLPVKSSDYGLYDYKFEYDWRLSPMHTAGLLKDYISAVSEASGGKKVILTGRCYGANVVAAYFQQFPEHAETYVERVTYYVSSVLGVDFIGAFFSGKIYLDADAVDNFVNYFLEDGDVIEDETLNTFIRTFVTLLNRTKLLGLTTDAFAIIVRNVCKYAVPMICRESFASFPSYWSMVGEEYYEDAMELIYGGHEETYVKLIEKCDSYYNNVMLKFDEICDSVDAMGIVTSVVAKYNTPLFPLSKGAATQGDGYTALDKQVFGGALIADYNKTIPDWKISRLETTDYLSPDRNIDASGCRYRDRTWFIKNLYHDHFPGAENAFFRAVMKDGIDINSDERYPQYIEYDSGNFYPITEESAEVERPLNIFEVWIQWLKSLFALIRQYFFGATGEGA